MGADGVDRADPQRRGELVLALSRDLPDRGGFLEHALRLLDNAGARRRYRDFISVAFEQYDAEFVLDLLDGDRQRRLTDEAFLRRASEMALARDGDDITQFGERHGRDRLNRKRAKTPTRPERL